MYVKGPSLLAWTRAKAKPARYWPSAPKPPITANMAQPAASGTCHSNGTVALVATTPASEE